MPLKHLLLIFLVIFSWGFSYVATKVGLMELPPFLFATLRFAILIIPALFIPFPKTKLSGLILFSLSMVFAQFALLFLAIKLGMPAGLASLVMQSQAFLTIIMGSLFLKETIKPTTLVGLFIAVLGLTVIGCDTSTNITMVGLIFTLLSALSWAIGNILIKKLQPINNLSLTVWGSVLSVIPLALSSLIFEGIDTITLSLSNLTWAGILSILYLGFIASLLAYTLWARMLSYYATNLIAPFSLLVPIIGMSSTAFFLHEHLTVFEVIGAAIILLGLSINVFGSRIMRFIKSAQ